MQLQNAIEKPVIFVSHILYDQASRWGIMELELHAFFHCIKQLGSYFIRKAFYSTDDKNLEYLSNSSISKLVR